MNFRGRTVIGLHIGIRSVRAMELRQGLRSIEPVKYYESPIQKGKGNEQNISAALKSLFSENKLYGRRVVVSYSGSNVTFRHLTFPFSEKKKIESVIGYEVEGILPLPLEDIVTDYIILGKVDGKTTVLCAIAEKERLMNHINTLKEADVDPDIVDIDLFALMNFFRFKQENLKENSLLMVLEEESTFVFIFHHGDLRVAKSISFGWNHIVENFRKNFNVDTFEEAEKQILQETDQMEVERVKDIAEELIVEMRRINFSYKRGGSGIDQYFFGGKRIAKRISEILGREMNIETIYWNPMEGMNITKTGIPISREYTAALCFGLGLSGINGKSKTVNLRKEEFPKNDLLRGMGGNLKGLILFLCSALLLITVDLSYKKWSLERQYMTLKEKGRIIFRKALPDVHNIVNEAHQLREKISEGKREYKIVGVEGNGGTSPLFYLRDITRSFPGNRDTQIFHYSFSGKEIKLEGKTGTFESVDKIKKELGKVKGISHVRVTETKLGADQGTVNFKMVLSLNGIIDR